MRVIVGLRDNWGITQKEVNATKTRCPKFSDHRGRTWDLVGRLDDGTEVYADTTWGFYGYFLHGAQWYKFPLFEKLASHRGGIRE